MMDEKCLTDTVDANEYYRAVRMGEPEKLESETVKRNQKLLKGMGEISRLIEAGEKLPLGCKEMYGIWDLLARMKVAINEALR